MTKKGQVEASLSSEPYKGEVKIVCFNISPSAKLA
jgi:hypothetical protein